MMKIKIINLVLVPLLVCHVAIGQDALPDLNNSSWQVTKLKASKKIKEVFYKSHEGKQSPRYKKAFVNFFNDSLVILKSCDTGKETVSVFLFRLQSPDSIELYGIDRYAPARERWVYKNPYFRKFRHYMFNYHFKIRRISSTKAYLVSKSPGISIRLRYLKKYTRDDKLMECDEL